MTLLVIGVSADVILFKIAELQREREVLQKKVSLMQEALRNNGRAAGVEEEEEDSGEMEPMEVELAPDS